MGKNNVRRTTEQFILESKNIFGDKYNYSKVDYKNNREKVCIICKKHGEFWQSPCSHLQGQEGCKECYKEKVCRNPFKTKDDFIKESIEIHGNKYDYSKVEYLGDKYKVCIICPKHGEFWQTPNNHLKGKGCPDCYGNRKLTKEKFIEEARKIHGDKYDYSKVEYKNIDTKVCIICPKHGEFWQTPSHHISGRGCPKCKMSIYEKTVKNTLDNLHIKYQFEVGKRTLKWIENLRLDFYIPDLNIAIEVQGEQHYKSINKFGGDDNLQKTIHRDKLKKSLCEKNGVKLYYIKYDDDIISETLKILKDNGIQI